MASQRADLSIVIVSWNTSAMLRACLESVFETTPGLRLQVIVVDNASSDGSAAMVRERFPQVELIESETNVGFAAANNRAFPACVADLVLLLNPDTVARAGAIERLVAFVGAHAGAGAVGPKVVHPQLRLRVLSSGYQPTLRRLFNHFFWLSSLFPRTPSCRGLNLIAGLHDDRVRPVEWIAGSCLLVRRAVIEQIGPLSTRWFMYSEDWEWCQRMLDGGWTLHHVPDAVVEHHVGAATEQNEAVSTMWVPSLRSYFVQRTQPTRLGLALFDVILVSGLSLRAAAYAVRSLLDRGRGPMWRRESRKFAAYVRAGVAGARGASS